MTAVLTGTLIAPPPEFTLAAWDEYEFSHSAPVGASTEGEAMTIEERQMGRQERSAQDETDSDWWEDPIERLRRMSDEEKAEYLERMLAKGRRQAHRMLGYYGRPTMSREELRDMLAEKYPGLTLSDQIIEDRRAWDKSQIAYSAPTDALTEGEAMTIEERQMGRQERSAQDETDSDWWEDPIERLRRMSDEEKAEYHDRLFAEGRRLASLMTGHYGPPTMSREELRDMLAEKYPGLTLSDQIIEDRRAGP